jgi:hypothetical protein
MGQSVQTHRVRLSGDLKPTRIGLGIKNEMALADKNKPYSPKVGAAQENPQQSLGPLLSMYASSNWRWNQHLVLTCHRCDRTTSEMRGPSSRIQIG